MERKLEKGSLNFFNLCVVAGLVYLLFVKGLLTTWDEFSPWIYTSKVQENLYKWILLGLGKKLLF